MYGFQVGKGGEWIGRLKLLGGKKNYAKIKACQKQLEIPPYIPLLGHTHQASNSRPFCMGRGHQSKYFSRVVEGAIFQWALLAVGVVTYKLYNTAEYSVLSLLLAVSIAIAPNEVRVSRCWTMSNSHRPQKSLGLVLDSHCSISTHSWIDINFIIRK